jgi:hypothetical protein
MVSETPGCSRRSARVICLEAFALAVVLGASPAAHAADEASDATQTEEGSGATQRDSDFALSLTFGFLSSLRRMEIGGDTDAIEHSPRPYLGGAAIVDARLARFESIGAEVGLRLRGHYAAARNREVSPTLGRTAITEHTLGAAGLTMLRRLSPAFDLEFELGAQVTSFTVERNYFYTGHRYFNLMFGVEGLWWPAVDRLSLGLAVAALPTIETNQSSDFYGDGRSFGVQLQGSIGFNIEPRRGGHRRASTRLELRYAYQRFRGQYLETSELGTEGSVSVDDQHFLSLALMLGL